MRQLDEDKVLELMSSYRESGQINPISLDKELTLLAGHHRLEAARKLGWKTIDAKIFDADDLHKRLIEISENLIRNDLCYIGTAEHIVERENILTALGKRTKRGENRYTKTHDTESTEDLAKKMGTSSKMYRLQRQVGELRPEVRNSLRGTDYGKRSLNDLLHLAKQDDEVQKKVGQLAKKNPEQTLRFHIDTAKIAIHTDRDKSQLVAELKEKWGVPMSIMRFDREDHQLARICRQISKHNKTRIIKGDVVGRQVPNYTGFVDHSLFLLEYFVRTPHAKLLDNFMGKSTNIIAGLWKNYEVHGFDLNPINIDRAYEVCDKHFSEGSYCFYNEDGIRMRPFDNQSEVFDAVITDPPYLNCPDLYTEEKEDLSNMTQEEWEEKMSQAFSNYARLIKTSSVKDKVFHPIMMRMESDPSETELENSMRYIMHQKEHDNPIENDFYPIIMKMNASRRAEKGMVSMDFILSNIAKSHGLTLWDRTFNMLAPTAVSVSTLRNYDFCYTQKNWETTLVWIKQ